MLCDRVVLEKHIYVTTAEKIQNSTLCTLTLNQEGPQQPLNQRPDFAQANRECKRLHGEHMAKTQQDYRTIPRSQQIRQRKGQAFEGIEGYDYAVDPRTSWRFHKESRETCRQPRPRQQIGFETIGRRAVGIPSILHGLTIREQKNLRVRTSFACLETNFQPTDGGCEQYTHK